MNTGYSQRLLFEIAVIPPFALQWNNATETAVSVVLTYYFKESTMNSEVLCRSL